MLLGPTSADLQGAASGHLSDRRVQRGEAARRRDEGVGGERERGAKWEAPALVCQHQSTMLRNARSSAMPTHEVNRRRYGMAHAHDGHAPRRSQSLTVLAKSSGRLR